MEAFLPARRHLTLLSPPFVVAASYILLFGPRGVLSYWLLGQSPNVLGLGGLWGVQTIAFFPFAYQLIADVLARSDAGLEQAARNLGADLWMVFRTVTLPLSRPGLAAATLMTAIYVPEDFGNPALKRLRLLVSGYIEDVTETGCCLSAVGERSEEQQIPLS